MKSSILADSRQRAAVVQKPKRTTRKRKGGKPEKPYPDFPLVAHVGGHWCKKIRGSVRYFGRWGKLVDGKLQRVEGDGWEAALAKYKEQADDLHAGRKPRAKGDGLTVGDACNAFLIAKERQRDSGEIAPRTFAEYNATTDRLVATFGVNRRADDLAADDFEQLRADIAKAWGPWRLGGEIQRVRTVWKYAYEAGLLDRPVRYGPQFKKPSKRTMRVHRAGNGSRMIEAAELRKLIDGAGVPLKAMILLGLNCGFGNDDCATLPAAVVDIEGGWIRYPRPKTGIDRRCPLWSETVKALRAAIDKRPAHKSDADAGLLFITKYGKVWQGKTRSNPISAEFRKLAESLDLYRAGVSFYSLRHVFRTVADGTRDFPAVRLIMGHADGSIDDVYREHIDDDRLRAVVKHVHRWLFAATPKRKRGAK